MRRLSFVAALVLPALAVAGDIATVDHDLQVRLKASSHRVDVVDRITLPAGLPGVPRFVLHAGLEPAVRDDGVELLELRGAPDPASFGIDPAESPFGDDVPLTLYELRSRDGSPVREVTLTYGGAIHHPLKEEGEDYARSFRETPGTIQDEGAYLAGSTFWTPWFGPHMVTFAMEVRPGTAWDALSAGTRASHEDLPGGVRVRWESPDLLDEIHLVAGPFTIYEDAAGPVAIYAYLRTPDEALARKYLDTTSQYLRMYADLIGPYPYAKFALVENFWETGYGMPSFTLLGPKIIRFPFILHSSYPHEILHNWWGNGVFVDAAEGNWCEGLTAYLADHLNKEQRGQGAEYRRDLLQKYADYVRDGNDIALTEFRQRHSSATQAVGYGKTAMVFHMLRRQLGDETFVEGLRTFYKNNRGRRASWGDVRAAFGKASGSDLASFFTTWVTRTGAPSVRINHVQGGAGQVQVVLGQAGEGKPYAMQVPLAITIAGRPDAVVSVVGLAGPATASSTAVDGDAVRVQVDPDFDLFRRLDRGEIPPSLGRVFGAPKVVIVLPSAAEGDLADAYRALGDEWSASQAGDVRVVEDSKLKQLPDDAAVWLFGWDNRFRDRIAPALEARGAILTSNTLHAGDRTLTRGEHDAVAAAPHPAAPDLAMAFLGSDNPTAVPGLGRKLPHYGKYGYLGFEGDAPDNILKGQWEAVGSPLDRSLVKGATPAAGTRPGRDALATLPPLFSAKRMLDDATQLADPAWQGRGCGEPGLALATDFIEQRFRELGLEPGVEGGYRQSFAARCGAGGASAELVNLVGILPGSDPEWSDQSVVVVAHYDHLGTGWPDAREGQQGKIHPGADDNASGVAVMLELARVLTDSLKPERPVVFLAVSGEESGLQGAKHYVAAGGPRPASKAIGALNLDTVGRLGDGKVLVLGAGSAAEWVHIVRGAGYVTGVPSQAVMDDLGSSDHKAFLDAGVPAVQFFTGPHLDYHRPGDTADKLDGDGLVRVATFVKEFVEYLAGREDAMTSKLAGAAPTSRGGSGRRVSLGSVPDFEHAGPGYRLSGVVPGSPAEAAGLQEGDVIVRIEDVAIEGLRDVSDALKGHGPGDRVPVTYVRDGVETTVTIELVAR